MSAANTLTVHELSQYIAQIVALDYRLKDIWVEGEVSNFKRYASGHAYFTLKDASSQLKCVMWKTSIGRAQYIPADGDRVRAHGRVEVYIENGVYQLYVDTMQPIGLGALFLEFERLKTRLQAEGLFDPAHKRELPRFPRVIGVVTSPTAAAFQDIQNVLKRRYPLARVLLSPTLVQGDQAPPQIVAAIRALNRESSADVILLARGGGSIEDLWAFNDERVARAVYDSAIPVVTGVGHEIDFTIVDFVSDLRAPTPSAGAELITPNSDELRAELDGLSAALRDSISDQIDSGRDQVEGLARSLRHLSPRSSIDGSRQRIDSLSERLQNTMTRLVSQRRERLTAQSNALDAANPTNLLRRGYAIVARTGDGKRLSSALEAAPGTGLTVTLVDGELRATVKERTLNDS